MQNNSSTSSRCFSRFPVAWSWQELCANKSLRQQHFDVYLTPVLDLNTLILEYAAPQLGDYKGLAKMHFPGNSLCGDCQQRVVQLADSNAGRNYAALYCSALEASIRKIILGYVISRSLGYTPQAYCTLHEICGCNVAHKNPVDTADPVAK
jgi:hypothetical protein